MLYINPYLSTSFLAVHLSLTYKMYVNLDQTTEGFILYMLMFKVKLKILNYA